MAIATGTAIALGVSAAIGAGQAVAGAAKERKAKRALEKFKRQDLESAAGGMRVSTLGAELQTQEAQRRFSTSVDALQSLASDQPGDAGLWLRSLGDTVAARTSVLGTRQRWCIPTRLAGGAGCSG